MMQEERGEIIEALALMWNQYCAEGGHQFMPAGEHAASVLKKYGLLHDFGDRGGEVNDETAAKSLLTNKE